MDKIKILDFQNIIKPDWSHKVGYGINTETGKLVKQKIAHQGTIPSDKNLLKKLGIAKKDKVLAIAGYYGDWASELKNLGADVDYSDVSSSLVNYAKKTFKNKFGKYICSGYELIPKKAGEYDWTFTYEACGGYQGLPVAYLRSLLNNKGGILIAYTYPKNPKSAGSKLETYPNIVNTLSEIYDTDKKVEYINITAKKKDEKELDSKLFLVCHIFTSDSARKKAEIDIKVLENLGHKNIIDLEKDSKTWNIQRSDLYKSLKRINSLTKLVKKEFIKEIKLKNYSCSVPLYHLNKSAPRQQRYSNY